MFFLYFMAMIDRFNLAFAALQRKTDLEFSDSVYGLAASLFFVTYVRFEIPGAVVAERGSVRKWTARIMLSWGVITIATAYIQNVLGTAEAGFFPGIIIYLTRWFTAKDRARAIAAFYVADQRVPRLRDRRLATPCPLDGASGWTWLFIVEGLRAVVRGAITLVYLTDYPAEAEWLPEVGHMAT